MQTVGTRVYATISSVRGSPSAPNRAATMQNAAVSSAGRANRSAGRLRSFFLSADGTAGSRKARMTTRNIAGTSVRTWRPSQPAWLAGFSRGMNRWMKLVSNLPARKVRIRQNALVQRNGGVNSLDHEHVERAPHPRDGFAAVAAVRDQLGHQRIVVRRNHAIAVGRGIHANADAARQIQTGDAARRRREGFGILGVDAALDGVAPDA